MDQTIKFIGFINSELKKLEECPRQETENAPEATLNVLPEFAEAIKDIKPGEEILIFTWLHQADRNTITCYPRDNREKPPTGVFSTRSPDRPNPIGIHQVKVISISNRSIKLASLEVLDQTPIIDIKPVLR